jgi:pyruvate kinase
MLDTVGPELQVVNKKETPISLEENGTVVLIRGKKPPPACCPSTSPDSPRLTRAYAVFFVRSIILCCIYFNAISCNS